MRRGSGPGIISPLSNNRKEHGNTVPDTCSRVTGVRASGSAAGRKPCHRLRVTDFALPGRAVFPDGITGGPGTTFYVGSLGDGTICRGDCATGEVTIAIPPDGDGRQAIAGLAIDGHGGLLSAQPAVPGCVSQVPRVVVGAGPQLDQADSRSGGCAAAVTMVQPPVSCQATRIRTALTNSADLPLPLSLM